MKMSHLALATLGSISLHVMVAYALFMGNMTIPKPSISEFVVTNVMLLDEPKSLENVNVVMPTKPEAMVEMNHQKNVKKVLSKPIPIREASIEQTLSHESLAEKTMAESATPNTQVSAPIVATRQNEDLLSLYLAKVRHKIQESLHYPSMAKKMGLEGETVVQFLIHANGMVDTSSIKIAKSSGKALLDRNAIDAILEALPFELPPKEDLEIVIPVVFKLKS